MDFEHPMHCAIFSQSKYCLTLHYGLQEQNDKHTAKI